MKENKFETKAIREGYKTSQEQEHSAAIFLTSSFIFDSAEQAAQRFAKEEQGNVYSRFTNPTVETFQDKLASLEGAESCLATASGMSAIFATIMALSKAGDHIVASWNVWHHYCTSQYHCQQVWYRSNICRLTRFSHLAGQYSVQHKVIHS